MPQPALQKLSNSLQTIQINSYQPNQEKEGEGQQEKKPEPKPKPKPQENRETKTKLEQRLEQLNISLDKRVQKALKTYSSYQIDAALDHVEKTWETIEHPQAVFLYQLPKQKNTKQQKVKALTARDFGGWTLEMIQKMYPTKWQEAAAHFGVSLSGEEPCPN